MNLIAAWFMNSLVGRYVLLALAIMAALFWKERRDVKRGREAITTKLRKEDSNVAESIRDDVRAGRNERLRDENLLYRD